ncbi:MAG: NADH:ubiquinone oxidoreductase [Synergistetes bacterium]|nr:NADH:ubiquinone oxidoreductase [Synergistota bacterium]
MEHLPILVIAIPLFAAFVIPIIGKVSNSKYLQDGVAVGSLLFSVIGMVLLMKRVAALGPQVYVFGAALPSLTLPSGMKFPIRIIFEVDGMSAFMALSGSIAALAGAIYSIAYTSRETGRDRFYVLFLLMVVGMLGMELTGDIFNFFVFLEISSIASVALIAFRYYNAESVEAAIKYMVVSSLAALFVLVAVGFLYGKYDALNFAAIAKKMEFSWADKVALILLVVSLALKCGAVPLHMWLPDAYAEAPASVTAVLVSVSQASLYGLFRTCFSLFGIKMSTLTVGWIVIVFGVLSMFIGVTMALVQKEIKRLMAFHAISQTGYMLLGVGVGLAVLGNPLELKDYGLMAMKGGIFHIINHAMYKGLLFLTAGAVFYRAGTRDLNKLGGLAHNMPWTTIYFIIGAAAIAGLPPFNGFASKLMIYESVYKFNPILSIMAMIVSVLTLASFVKIFQSAFLGPQLPEYKDLKEAPTSMLVGMGILAFVVIFFGLFPELIVRGIVDPAAKALIDQATYISKVVGGM